MAKTVTSSKRAAAAIAAVLAIATPIGGVLYANHVPAAVQLAADALILPWEGLVLTAHWDTYSKRYDICHGDTLVNGKPVYRGMTRTKEQCHDMFMVRIQRDFYKPLTKCVVGYTGMPISLQASMLSGAYNFGLGGQCKSRTAKLAVSGAYHTACLAQMAWNKAGGEVVPGLVNRRGMGDAQRIGEAELCVSGLKK